LSLVVQVVFNKYPRFLLFRRTSNYQSRSYNTLDDFVDRDATFHLVYQDVGGLLTYPMATLFDGCQHRVTGYSTLTVGKATNADILRYAEAHVLGSIQNADSRIVVDGKESIGGRIFL
jgi:hypothetical protein